MKKYVCGFMKDAEGRVALVRKKKPTWQAGKLNGIGGGVESDETPHFAMCREWREETGDSFRYWEYLATLTFADSEVVFFKADVFALPYFPAANDIGEPIEIHPYLNLLRYEDMIPNLKWLLPLAFEDSFLGNMKVAA